MDLSPNQDLLWVVQEDEVKEHDYPKGLRPPAEGFQSTHVGRGLWIKRSHAAKKKAMAGGKGKACS